MIKVKIKETSLIARVAANKLNCNSVAIVVGRTIHLHNVTKEEFLNNKPWLRHEVAHVKQYMELGIIRFIASYLIQSLKKGYENNYYEIQARQKESDVTILEGVYFT